MARATCERCGSAARLRRGLCRRCRRMEPTQGHLPAEPDLEPAHDRPWVARSAFTGRKRRSPRT